MAKATYEREHLVGRIVLQGQSHDGRMKALGAETADGSHTEVQAGGRECTQNGVSPFKPQSQSLATLFLEQGEIF